MVSNGVADGALQMKPINRRNFLMFGALAALSVARPSSATARAAYAVAPTVIRIEIRDGQDDVARAFGHALRSLSGVEYSTENCASGADAWIGSAQGLVDLDPKFAYFAGLPGAKAMPRTALMNWIGGEGGTLLQSLSRSYGLETLVIAHSEIQGLWRRQTLDDVRNLKGRCVSARGLSRDVVRGLGGHAVDALSPRNCVDICDGRPPPDLRRDDELQWRCVSSRALSPHGEAIVAAFDRDYWRRMSESSRQLLIATSLRTARLFEASHPIRRAISSDGDCEQFNATADSVAAAVIADVGTQNATSRRIDDSYWRAARAMEAV
jgi:hypothetical protein